VKAQEEQVGMEQEGWVEEEQEVEQSLKLVLRHPFMRRVLSSFTTAYSNKGLGYFHRPPLLSRLGASTGRHYTVA